MTESYSRLAPRPAANPNRTHAPHPSLTRVFAIFTLLVSLARAHEPVADMLDARKISRRARRRAKDQGRLSLSSDEREKWFFVPIARKGCRSSR